MSLTVPIEGSTAHASAHSLMHEEAGSDRASFTNASYLVGNEPYRETKVLNITLLITLKITDAYLSVYDVKLVLLYFYGQ